MKLGSSTKLGTLVNGGVRDVIKAKWTKDNHSGLEILANWVGLVNNAGSMTLVGNSRHWLST